MIEFTGYLTGAAEKHFVRKTRSIALKLVAFALLFTIPMVFFLVKNVLHDERFYYMLLALGVFPLLCVIPRGKKEHFSMLPKRIYTEDDQIICVAERYTDTKYIDDVEKVIDHGEFYELCFPFGKISEKFVCQKSLLTKGSLSEFESLFDGKLIRL